MHDTNNHNIHSIIALHAAGRSCSDLDEVHACHQRSTHTNHTIIIDDVPTSRSPWQWLINIVKVFRVLNDLPDGASRKGIHIGPVDRRVILPYICSICRTNRNYLADGGRGVQRYIIRTRTYLYVFKIGILASAVGDSDEESRLKTAGNSTTCLSIIQHGRRQK